MTHEEKRAKRLEILLAYFDVSSEQLDPGTYSILVTGLYTMRELHTLSSVVSLPLAQTAVVLQGTSAKCKSYTALKLNQEHPFLVLLLQDYD